MSLAAALLTALLLGGQPAPPGRVLIVLTAVDRLPKASSGTGNFLREVAYPVMKLAEARLHGRLRIAGWQGKPALVRGNEAYGLAPDAGRDPVLQAFADRYLEEGRLRQTRRPADLRAADYAAVFYAGALGTLIDVAADEQIAAITREVHDGGGIVAASGHGIAGLLLVRTRSGEPLLRGRRAAAFTRDEDVAFFHERLGWRDVLPYHVEERIREAGAVVEKKEKFAVNVVQDGRIISAQNAGSVQRLTELLLELLKE